MAKEINCDVAIIGAGSAGLTAYRAVLKAGKRPLLIEGGPHGTMCARVGCMPSKLLIAAADAAAAINKAPHFGINVNGSVQVDGKAVMQRVRTERDRFVSFVVNDIAALPQENVLNEYVEFQEDGILQTASGTKINAKSVIIATGTTPVIPNEYKILGDLAIVNDDVFDWQDLPASILVVGSGVIGVELGLALAKLGVRVRVLNRSKSFAHVQDPIVYESAIGLLQGKLNLVQNAKISDIKRENDQAVISWLNETGEKTTESFDYVLLAAGRSPVIDALHLERTSMQLNEKGMPVVNSDTLQIQNQAVFMAGDVNKHHAIQHEASDDGHIAGTNAANYPNIQVLPRRAPISVVFSDPQIMQVGGGWPTYDANTMSVGSVDWSRQGRSRVMLLNEGVLRVYMNNSDQAFVGAEMIGPNAEHVAHLLAWSLQAKLTVPEMLAMPYYHPTIEEGVRTALRDVLANSKA